MVVDEKKTLKKGFFMLDFEKKTKYNEIIGDFDKDHIMKKTVLSLILGGCLLLSGSAMAQLAFWNYDDSDIASQIPAECDGVFDENRGGVFMPTAEQMAAQGEEFLLDADPTIRNKAGYCLIGAALQGDIPSQYRVAQLYSKGIVLPQDDLSAYRWAFLASLNGHEEATKLALLLERFLTAEEIETATSTLQQMLPTIKSRYQSELDEQNERLIEKQKELDAVNREIDIILGIKPLSPTQPPQKENNAQAIQKATPKGNIFSESDRKR
jgi:hypothetical protein